MVNSLKLIHQYWVLASFLGALSLSQNSELGINALALQLAICRCEPFGFLSSNAANSIPISKSCLNLVHLSDRSTVWPFW